MDDYQCAFCLSLLYDPVTLDCKHSFCLFCVKQYYSQQLRARRLLQTNEDKKLQCPLCRKQFVILDWNVNKELVCVFV
jgi:tripartite motif-containing protein 16